MILLIKRFILRVKITHTDLIKSAEISKKITRAHRELFANDSIILIVIDHRTRSSIIEQQQNEGSAIYFIVTKNKMDDSKVTTTTGKNNNEPPESIKCLHRYQDNMLRQFNVLANDTIQVLLRANNDDDDIDNPEIIILKRERRKLLEYIRVY